VKMILRQAVKQRLELRDAVEGAESAQGAALIGDRHQRGPLRRTRAGAGDDGPSDGAILVGRRVVDGKARVRIGVVRDVGRAGVLDIADPPAAADPAYFVLPFAVRI